MFDPKNYSFTKEDIEVLFESGDLLFSSDLLDKETLDDFRIVSYDSSNFYILTQGEHISTENYKVEKIETKNNINLYKIEVNYEKFIGKNENYYWGGSAWGGHPAMIETAVNPKLVPDPKVLSNKSLILKIIRIPPFAPFNLLQEGKFDYLTDLIFHETAHVEEMLIRDWPIEGQIEPFPNEENIRKFIELIRRTNLIPKNFLGKIINSIDRGTIGEMYAILVDREAKRRFGRNVKNEYSDFKLEEIDNYDEKKIEKILNSFHKRGFILVLILEEQIKDYFQRKRFIQDLMKE